MDKSWLDRYPKAAAMLQGDDDVLLYEPRSCRGLEAPDALDPSGAAALPDDVPPGALAAAQAMARRVDAAMLTASERASAWARLTLLEPSWRLHDTRRHALVPRFSAATLLEAAVDLHETPVFQRCDTLLDARMWQPAGQPCPCGQVRWYQEHPPLPELRMLPDVVEIWQPDREVRLEPDDVEEIDRGDW